MPTATFSFFVLGLFLFIFLKYFVLDNGYFFFFSFWAFFAPFWFATFFYFYFRLGLSYKTTNITQPNTKNGSHARSKARQ